ncbi:MULTISPECIES: hypothetical protein [unclassified Methylobacterium]|jgi:hypothetical protein|uniref:hypothetical protein n=1 Tax=unclassified Methylobacterium TaxID=2615210 RepID=UPI000A98769F|nr:MULTISPECIES: hypothetical protein [unclassified Methylobacterium]USU31888.1 hypothetical protein NG677_21790 [Methylobacterium sp. OTU13CASTA1]
MTERRRPAPFRRLALCLVLGLSACDKPEEPAEASRAPEEQTVVATRSDADIPPWLSPTDAMEPARWLASRELGRPVPEVGSGADHLRHSLARAKDAFIEDPRMVANRTVQLGQMLVEAGTPEPYADLLDGLEAVAAVTTRKQLYGEMCQQYYNTRRQGADRATALARLTERYAAQGSGDDRGGGDHDGNDRSGPTPAPGAAR